MRVPFLLGIIFLCNFIFAQKVKTVSAEYTYYAPENLSIEVAKSIALERAKTQAIADEYGTQVSQNSSSVILNKNGQSENYFFFIGENEIKGEWLETIGDPVFNIEYSNHILTITCFVNGRIMPSKPTTIDFNAHILCNGTDIKFENTEFKNGDDMYLLFNSPFSGYLTAFWIDRKNQTVYRILPYLNTDENLFKTKPNHEYLFFYKSNQYDYMTEADEYRLTCNDYIEYNELCVCYSDNPYTTPIATKTGDGMLSISIPTFEKWKSKTRLNSDNVRFKSFQISIFNQGNINF